MADETITKEKSDMLVTGIREALAKALQAGLPLCFARSVLDWEAARARQSDRDTLIANPRNVAPTAQYSWIANRFGPQQRQDRRVSD